MGLVEYSVRLAKCAIWDRQRLAPRIQSEEYAGELERTSPPCFAARSYWVAEPPGHALRHFCVRLWSNANLKDAMNWKPQDWIEHASFGLGRVNENRGDRLDIEFISFGAKTILTTAELKHADSPPDFKLPSVKGKSATSRIRVEPAARRPSKSAGVRKISAH
jgi:hypothetical protein